ncbi:182_t:CDS:2, partial [Ambispora gerdemannii]
MASALKKQQKSIADLSEVVMRDLKKRVEKRSMARLYPKRLKLWVAKQRGEIDTEPGEEDEEENSNSAGP